ncbi:DUF502 domain-containing protein [bacterium]|jgi:uncharacterized membrane protein|nr:DUF502 domain-containing protein [bacterium]
MDEHKTTFVSSLKKSFFAGIATIFPLFVSVYIIVIIFRFADQLTGKYVNALLIKEYGFSIPGLGFLTTILIILIVGFISSHIIGIKIFPVFEKLILKIPFIAHIYPSAKELSDSLFSSNKKDKFKKVVLVEYPTKESYSLGFITNEELYELNRKANKNLITVFVPLAPAPFSGMILFVPKDKIIELDISVDKAIKCIVSGGVIPPQNGKS